MTRLGSLILLTSLVVVAGCSNSTVTPSPLPTASSATSSIQHIVVLVQENRSFNTMFAGFPGANTAMSGACKPAKSKPWCPPSHVIPLRSIPLEKGTGVNKGTDIDHSHHGFEVECDAKGGVCQMDGFNLINTGESGQGVPAKRIPYSYVERSETKPYWDFARQYTLSDNMFFTETASSFIAHQILLSGTVQLSNGEWVTDQPGAVPWGCDAVPGDNAPTLLRNGFESFSPGVFPCFKWGTLADLLDAKSVSWFFYVDTCCTNPPYDFSGGAWNGYRAIHKIFYGPDYKKNISSPNTNIFSDVKNGTLPSVSWVIPSLYDSDHPASGCNGGPWWVSRVVNAIGTSNYWKNTAIIVLWDDWGGWYDPAQPKIINPSTLGMRVPMIVISPYAKPGNVSHTQYEFGSILKLIEQTFGLGSLGTTDASAPSMSDVFNFSQTPNTFTAEPLPDPLPCAKHVTNPGSEDGMKEVIEHDGGVPE
jgi:phospholipase C